MSNNDNDGSREQYRPFWEKTCLELYQRLISYAFKLVNGKNYDAVDLVQETVARTLFYSPNPEGIRSPLGYLMTVMRHAWTDKWKHEHTIDTESLEDLQETNHLQHLAIEPDVLRILENMDFLKRFSDKRGQLTAREALLLTKHLEGYSCAEIATILGEDERLTRSDLNAVRVKVRYRLQK